MHVAAPWKSDLLGLIRELELRRLDARAQVYLDYTGAALYPDSLLRQHVSLLRNRTLGNPHADSPAAQAATDDISAARRHVLRHFDADPAEYDVAFTANASAALRLVGESFPWSAASQYLLSADNHNSVNGIREFARAAGARIRYLPLDPELRLAPFEFEQPAAPSLLAFPAQSNFSGVQHPLGLVQAAQRRGYRVLLDAAAFVPTSCLSLRAVPADFVAVSFYKMFGYPTGIGALIARRAALAELRRPWFAGGTVDYVSIAADTHALKPDAEAFEDGTVNFLAASAVSSGLSFLERIGTERIRRHVQMLTEHLLDGLHALRVVEVHGPHDTSSRGGTVAFNVLDRAGRRLPCDQVLAAAGSEGISLRSGCFCNPGAAEHALGIEHTRRREGALRASVGYGSNHQDIDALLNFLAHNYGS